MGDSLIPDHYQHKKPRNCGAFSLVIEGEKGVGDNIRI